MLVGTGFQFRSSSLESPLLNLPKDKCISVILGRKGFRYFIGVVVVGKPDGKHGSLT
jgi:hypothetical protein